MIDAIVKVCDFISLVIIILCLLYELFKNYLNQLSDAEKIKFFLTFSIIVLTELLFNSYLKRNYDYYNSLEIKILFLNSLKVFFGYIPISIGIWALFFKEKYQYSSVVLATFPICLFLQFYFLPTFQAELILP